MGNRTKIASLILIVFTCFSFAGGPWKVVKSDGNVKVYNRKVSGYSMPESKVLTTISKGNIDKAFKIMTDFSTYHTWIPSCSSSKLLKKNGNKYIWYATYDAPWPVSDRDIVVESTFIKTKEKLIIRQKALPSYIAKKDGFVRVPLSNGGWKFKLKQGGKMYLENTSLASPGGSIPDWLTATATQDVPLELMQNMVKKF